MESRLNNYLIKSNYVNPYINAFNDFSLKFLSGKFKGQGIQKVFQHIQDSLKVIPMPEAPITKLYLDSWVESKLNRKSYIETIQTNLKLNFGWH